MSAFFYDWGERGRGVLSLFLHFVVGEFFVLLVVCFGLSWF